MGPYRCHHGLGGPCILTAQPAASHDPHSSAISRSPRSVHLSSSCCSSSSDSKESSSSPSCAPCGSSISSSDIVSVSYTHLRAHETPEHLVCRLLLEKKKIKYVYVNV
eukprot:TRINITY_DN18073_c0_g1_i1.p1 TRINITY_DN18073_c0_g1~~TRINITY_DN18073_c0_g1_i1.p1  ORF type:complete len:108 (+),score=8.02 TRINITY_DN18073_c0_g1_i1:433-756(+)